MSRRLFRQPTVYRTIQSPRFPVYQAADQGELRRAATSFGCRHRRGSLKEMSASRVAAHVRCTLLCACLLWLFRGPFVFDCVAAEMTYPQVMRARYEAINPKTGGSFIIWLDRERMWHGLDPRLYPPVKYVQVTHITPSPGSPIITVIVPLIRALLNFITWPALCVFG